MYRIDFTPLKDLLRRFTEKGPSGCAMIVSRKGETVFSHYEGVSDLNSGHPMQEDTIFQLHSNSKLIAVVAAMQLYEQGLLSLNDPVEMYLPEFKGRQVISYAGNNMFTEKPARNKVRIKHLMNMTDGSAGWISEGEVTPAHAAVREIYRRVKDRNDVSLREFSRLSSQIPLLFEPGTSFNYGIGINVVAAVVEELAGMEFEEYLKENVFTNIDSAVII